MSGGWELEGEQDIDDARQALIFPDGDRRVGLVGRGPRGAHVPTNAKALFQDLADGFGIRCHFGPVHGESEMLAPSVWLLLDGVDHLVSDWDLQDERWVVARARRVGGEPVGYLPGGFTVGEGVFADIFCPRFDGFSDGYGSEVLP